MSHWQFHGQSGIAGPKIAGIPVIPLEETVERHNMSGALWYDKGEHAFSAKDPDKRHFTQTAEVQVPTGNSYGMPTYQQRQTVTEELDICGPCWKKGNDFTSKAIKNPDQPTLDELEEEDENYRRGYQAAMDKILEGEAN